MPLPRRRGFKDLREPKSVSWRFFNGAPVGHSTLMKPLLAALTLMLAMVSCKNETTSKPASSAHIAELSVDEAARALQDGSCVAIDANGPPTRKRMGTIPGAVLLSDYEAFALSELPADKAKGLVFYCANEYCDASHEAAKRARVAGYSNVRVMPAGIAGWVKAEKPVTKL